jgi:hypothetical protein
VPLFCLLGVQNRPPNGVKTIKIQVRSRSLLQCEILQQVQRGKSGFLGQTLTRHGLALDILAVLRVGSSRSGWLPAFGASFVAEAFIGSKFLSI